LHKGMGRDRQFADGTRQGINNFNRIGYDGPCPPRRDKPHRYFFKLYALDSMLVADSGITKDALLVAMEGHVLATTELIGMYQRV